MNKQNYSFYLKIVITTSFLFVIISLLFFRGETIINTNTMTKEFYYEYMSRDVKKYSIIILYISYFLIFIIYSLCILSVIDKMNKCGYKNLIEFLKYKYLFIISMFVIIAIKEIILNMLMEYHIAVYFINPIIVALITLRYISNE